jgi:hypothetical protein
MDTINLNIMDLNAYPMVAPTVMVYVNDLL